MKKKIKKTYSTTSKGQSKYAAKLEARRRLAAKLGVGVAPLPILWAEQKLNS